MSARLVIDLAAMVANYQTLRDAAGARVGAVVKANAYGLGADAIATVLAKHECQEFFVATALEGTRLRATLPQHKIYVLNGVDPTTRVTLEKHQLTPVLNSKSQVECWQPSGRAAALHLDTGMNRLGIAPAMAEQIASTINFDVELLMTHFARADDQDPASTQQQVQSFTAATQHLRRIFPNAEVSLSNSAAALAGGVGDQLVRGGIALYGGNPFHAAANPMQPVVRLEAKILQLHDVPKGSAVGYGGSYVCPEDRRLATVAVGYADGVPRLLSDRGEVSLHGQRCPIVGRISMDMLHIDVSEVATAQEHDWVEVMGTTIGIDEVAEHAQTLGYEILTGLDAAQRLERIYTPAS